MLVLMDLKNILREKLGLQNDAYCTISFMQTHT